MRLKVYDRNGKIVTINPAYKIMPETGGLDEPINCINCGKLLLYGDTYISRNYFTKNGFGFNECEDCYFDKTRW